MSCSCACACACFYSLSSIPPTPQPFAEVFGLYCDIEAVHTMNFAEEVIRGQSVFVLGWVLTALEGQLRAAAGAGPWQVGGGKGSWGMAWGWEGLADGWRGGGEGGRWVDGEVDGAG